MKLNIYEKRKIVKTYEADEYELTFGVLEDVASAIKLDSITTGSDAELMKLAMAAVLQNIDTVKDLMIDIFDCSEDDLRHASVKDMARVLMDVAKTTLRQLKEGLGGKN